MFRRYSLIFADALPWPAVPATPFVFLFSFLILNFASAFALSSGVNRTPLTRELWRLCCYGPVSTGIASNAAVSCPEKRTTVKMPGVLDLVVMIGCPIGRSCSFSSFLSIPGAIGPKRVLLGVSSVAPRWLPGESLLDSRCGSLLLIEMPLGCAGVWGK